MIGSGSIGSFAVGSSIREFFESIVIGDGTLTFGGAAVSQIEFEFIGEGDIVFSGIVPIDAIDFINIATGGIAFDGTAVQLTDFNFIGEGGIVFPGTALPPEVEYIFLTTGGIVFSGAGDIDIQISFKPWFEQNLNTLFGNQETQI